VVIQVFGADIAHCGALAATVASAVAELGLDHAEIYTIDDPAMIVARGIWRAPALAIDGKVVVRGRTPSADEIAALLKAAARR
jgi:small redox-active disulfide protein 2